MCDLDSVLISRDSISFYVFKGLHTADFLLGPSLFARQDKTEFWLTMNVVLLTAQQALLLKAGFKGVGLSVLGQPGVL